MFKAPQPTKDEITIIAASSNVHLIVKNRHRIRERTIPNKKGNKICQHRNEKASRLHCGLLFLSSIRINWLNLQIGVGNTIFLLKKSNFWR